MLHIVAFCALQLIVLMSSELRSRARAAIGELLWRDTLQAVQADNQLAAR